MQISIIATGKTNAVWIKTGIEEYAKELNIPVFEGAQLSEKPEEIISVYSDVVEEATVA